MTKGYRQVEPSVKVGFGAWLALVLLFVSPAAPAQSPVELRQDLARLLEWLPGEYDNEPQVFLEEGLGPPPDGVHPRRHSVFAVIDAPHLGQHVIYWQERSDGKSGGILRQRVLILEADEESLALRMTMYPIEDPERHQDLQKKVPLQRSVQIQAGTMVSECPLSWTRDIDQLQGRFAASCRVTPPGRVDAVAVEVSWSLSKEELWILDRARDHTGWVTGRADGFPLKYYRVRSFECYVALELGNDTRFVENPFFLHDRGDQAVFSTGATKPSTVRVVLRRSMWPSRSGRNFVELLRIVLYLDDSTEPSGLGWATPESSRVGFGTGAAQARCKLQEG